MRRIALSLAICLASYGCANEESEPPAGGNDGKGGSLAGSGGASSTGGSPLVPSGGTTSTTGGSAASTGGVPSGAGGAPLGTAGSAGTPTTGTAGTASGGAAPGGGTCTATAVAAGTPLLIDDFEDGNADIMAVDGRVGGWYLATDMTGTTTPLPGAPMPEVGGMPGKAVHVTGSGLTMWGASLSATLTPKDGCYNGSKFTGITVMMKGTGAVWVSVLTAAVRGAPVGQQNHFKKLVTLSADWQPVTIEFSELMQPGGWGLVVPFDAAKIYGIDFGPSTTTGMPTAFDFWVDNLSFK